MKVTALIQARMGSTRFPAKVLAPILGKPMLEWQLDRLGNSKEIHRLVVATSDLPGDDPIAAFCSARGVLCFRGSEASVLDRFYGACLRFLPEEERSTALLVRLTGDCPLADSALIDEGIREFKGLLGQGCRYFGYDDRMPDGMDFEVFTWEALGEAFRSATDSFEKEHATPYMWRNPTLFKVRKFYREGIEPGLRFSVDYEEDRQLVEAILKREQKAGRPFGLLDIAHLLAEDEALRAINGKIIKNEGIIKTSLASEPFRVLMGGTRVARYGVAVPQGQALTLPEEMITWAANMGVEVWGCSASELSLLKGKLKKLGLDSVSIFPLEELPKAWKVVAADGSWEKSLLKITEDTSVDGVLLEVADRGQLAQMLMFLCQKRFSL
jgi:spore coat polysaccharide biosynthesis protein SpsF